MRKRRIHGGHWCAWGLGAARLRRSAVGQGEQRHGAPGWRRAAWAPIGACLLALSGCAAPGAPAPSAAQPPPPKFYFQQDFSGDRGELLATVDREVYPAHYAGLWHTHPGPGSFCVLQGTLVVEVRGGADVPLQSGQCWQEQPGVIHRPVNRTDQEATALFFLLAPANGPRILAAPTPTPRR